MFNGRILLRKIYRFNAILIVVCALKLISCSSESPKSSTRNISISEKMYYNGIGFGPIQEVIIPSGIDDKLAANGEEVFNVKCITCHSLSEKRKIGPGLYGVTTRRRPEWIMNQIINPVENTQKDSLAKELLSIYLAQMVPMNVSNEEARAVLEFFRKTDLKDPK
jgi:mono/diheme cytochrome c family protein